MKIGGGKQKGNAFERECCKVLSFWWSGGKRDDVFYRTQSSGGRATQRAKKGKTCSNHNGDVAATDDEGLPFTRFVTVEIKRGYSGHSPYDHVDSAAMSHPSKFEEWCDQAKSDHQKAKTKGWLLITKRDRKRIMVFMPDKIAMHLDLGIQYDVKFPSLGVIGIDFETFFRRISPKNFRA